MSTRPSIAGVAALSIAACAAAPAPGPVAESSVVVKWLPACSLGVNEPHYTVEVAGDGAVKFVGGPQTRETGERTERIQSQDAQRVIKEANQFVTRPSGPSAQSRTEQADDDSYCLEVAVHDGRTSSTKRGRSDEQYTQALLKALDETVHASKWVCPPRYGSGAPSELRVGPAYCPERPIMSVYLSDLGTCASGHSVNIYADGTVRYFASRVQVVPGAGKRPRTTRSAITDQQYFTLKRDDFDRIIGLVNGFQLKGDSGCLDTVVGMACTENSPVREFRSSDDSEIDTLNREIRQALGASWAEIAPDRDQCPGAEKIASRLSVKPEYVSGPRERVR